MTWSDFIKEYNLKYYNQMVTRAQQNDFINMKQGSIWVTEAVHKFDRLAWLCSFLVAMKDAGNIQAQFFSGHC